MKWVTYCISFWACREEKQSLLNMFWNTGSANSREGSRSEQQKTGLSLRQCNRSKVKPLSKISKNGNRNSSPSNNCFELTSYSEKKFNSRERIKTRESNHMSWALRGLRFKTVLCLDPVFLPSFSGTFSTHSRHHLLSSRRLRSSNEPSQFAKILFDTPTFLSCWRQFSLDVFSSA